MKTDLERFEEKWMPEPFSGCWLWLLSVHGNNKYGHAVWNGRHTEAHRLSWTLHRGEIPEGLRVLHKCDTPTCVNPDHLFLGTQKDNITDMIKKGRKIIARGSRHGNAKLNETDVEEIRSIRANGMSSQEIATRFSVSQRTVQHIVSRDGWKHLA